MKKKSLLILFLAMTLVFTGCSKKKDAADEPAAEAAAEETATADTAEGAEAETAAEEAAEPEPEPVKPVNNIRAFVRTEQKTFTKGYSPYYEYIYGTVHLADEYEGKYPELAKSFVELGKYLEDKVNANMEENLPTAAEWYEENKDDNGFVYAYYSDEHDLSIVRADSCVVSVKNDYTGYSGGAHGWYGVEGYNYDTETGKKLEIEDVFSSREELIDTLYTELLDHYQKEYFYNYNELKEDIEESIGYTGLKYTIGYTGINVHFDPYDIAPYASGSFDISLPFNKYGGTLINAQYANTPDSFIIKVPEAEEIFYDLNADGTDETILIETIQGDTEEGYYDIDQVKVTVGDKKAYADAYCFYMNFYFVKDVDKYFIYSFCTAENDYTYVMAFDITSGEPVYLEQPEDMTESTSLAAALVGGDYDNDDYYASTYDEYCFTDPTLMLLSSHTDVMSTVSGSCYYAVGESGYPEKLDKDAWYYLQTDYFVFTAKQDVVGTEVTEDGATVGEYVIAPGTECIYYRTDGKNLADLKIGDTIVRLEIDSSEWPTCVNGIDLEEAFDGILWAG